MKNKNISKLIVDNILYICLILMIIIIAIISPSFISGRVLSDVLIQSAPKILLAMGMLVVIIAGGMDMTVGRLAGLGAVVAGTLAQTSDYYLKFWPGLGELPLFVPLLVTVLTGLFCGAITGIIISKLRVPAFLAGVGLQLVIYGGNLLLLKKAPNNSQPLAGYKVSFTNFGTGSIMGVNYMVIVAVLVMIAVYILLNHTTLGKNIYATGGNRDAAKVAGINIFKIDMFVYLLSGALAAFAGCMMAARTGSATAAYAEGYEMDAIASCIIGGASFTGGIGNVPGTFLGVIIFSVINYGLTFIGLSSYWQYIVKGLIIIVAVALDMRKYASQN
ncbi:MAG: beta-methylgalactoside transporter [Lachnospiraceae bacterium]|nr:beta-methylgalactoside transporter [Lachnospiraceae bacterium]